MTQEFDMLSPWPILLFLGHQQDHKTILLRTTSLWNARRNRSHVVRAEMNKAVTRAVCYADKFDPIAYRVGRSI